jgi:hypothetical protein
LIAKITRGNTFQGAVRYVRDDRPFLNPERQPEIIGGNMAGRTSQELAREFDAIRQQRPDVEKPVEHVSLSFPRDERPFSNEEMARIAEDYVRRRDYDPERCQYVVVRHHDKDHPHCHILLNRVRTDRTLVPQQYREFLRNKEVCRALERDHGLRPVVDRRGSPERSPTRGEDRMVRDRGLPSEKEQLKALIREAAQGRPTMSEFVRRLEGKGVQVRPNIASGHVSGISYRLDRVAVKGSQLGRAYTFAGLQREQGVGYVARQDNPELERAAQATLGQEPIRRRPDGPRLPLREVQALRRTLRDLQNLGRSPEKTLRGLVSRSVFNAASRLLPPPERAALSVIRKIAELSRGR